MRKSKFVYQNVVVDDLGTKEFIFFICKSAFLPVMKIKAWDVFLGAYGILTRFWPLRANLDTSIASVIHLPYDINWRNDLSDFEYMVFDISQNIANILNLTPF